MSSSADEPRERVPWWRTDLGADEIDAVARAMRERRINLGPTCARLEARLAVVTGAPYVAVTTSGSVALLLALMAAGVGPGDEVVVPACTFIAPAHAALLLRASVKLVDVGRDRPLLDPATVASALTDRTKAVVAVHLDGRACDVAAVRRAASSVGAVVVEDCAQALCSRGPQGALGTLGDLAAFSMGITKLVTTAEGGFVAVRDEATWDLLVRLRNHGAVELSRNRFDAIGCNFRLTDLQAAIGLAQLDKLDARVEGVRRVYRYYREHLAGLPFMRLLDVREEDGELPLWAEVLCAERERVVAHLRTRGIEAKPFHPSLADSPHLATRGEFPNARRFAALGLTLPSGPDQPESALRRTVDALREVGASIATRLEA